MPSTSPLLDAAALQARLAAATPPVLLDCSFDLADTDAGERAWRAGHLPGAHFLHLDRDLCGPTTGPDGRFRGRHPLPARADFAAAVGRLGIGPDTAVVAYDRQGGVYASHAWWMLRWLGHPHVTVLDGGVAAWQAAGGALSTDTPTARDAGPYPAGAALVGTVEADALQVAIGRLRLIDARAGERFRGETEPIDPVAGHIPGALNRPFKDNLGADGRFLPAAQLRAAFAPLLAGRQPTEAVHYCGSGVTACHNLLAMEVAGLAGSLLYPGSWSEWIGDPARPLARG